MLETVLRARETGILVALIVVLVVARPRGTGFLFIDRRRPRPAAHADDPDARRRRPGDRHHHPQRRPLGRLDPRAHAYLAGCALRHVPRHSDRGRSSRGRARACSGVINGVLVAFAKVPALVITLGTLYIYRGIDVRWAGGDRINASDLPVDFRGSARAGARHPVPLDLIACGRARRRLVPAQPPAAAASSTRSARTPTPRTSTASGCTRRILAAFVVSGALAGLAGVLYAARYATVGLPRRHRLGAAGGGRRGGRRGGHLGGSAPSGAPPSAPSCSPRSAARCRCSASRASGSRPSSAIFIVVAITLDRVLAIRRARAAVAQRNLR